MTKNKTPYILFWRKILPDEGRDELIGQREYFLELVERIDYIDINLLMQSYIKDHKLGDPYKAWSQNSLGSLQVVNHHDLRLLKENECIMIFDLFGNNIS